MSDSTAHSSSANEFTAIGALFALPEDGGDAPVAFLGTCFSALFTNDSAAIVTARHVLEDSVVPEKQIVAIFGYPDGLLRFGPFEWMRDGEHDVAVAIADRDDRVARLEIRSDTGPLPGNEDVVCVELSQSVTKPDVTFDKSHRKGNIVRAFVAGDGPQQGSRLVEVSFAALKGASGAPVMHSETAEVIGMVVANHGQQLMPAQVVTVLDEPNNVLEEVAYFLPQALALHFTHLTAAIDARRRL